MKTTDCLELVERSPAAVATHDKQGWLDIFSRNCVVEDPVGSTPHVSSDDDQGSGSPLSRFYDTFIAANDIRFLVERDTVCDLHVVRDLSIEITMSPQVVVTVPMHLLYELTEQDGELRIARLAAHWELGAMLRQQMVPRWATMKTGSVSFLRMLRHLGIGGVFGFLRALSTVGTRGKQQVVLFGHHFNARNREAFVALFAQENIAIDAPYGVQQMTPIQLLEAGGKLTFGKMLAAGSVISTSFTCRADDNTYQGVALFTLDSYSLSITDLKLYW